MKIFEILTIYRKSLLAYTVCLIPNLLDVICDEHFVLSQMTFAEPQDMADITVCVWYNSGNLLPTGKDPLFLIREVGPDEFDRMSMKVDNVGQLIYKVKLGGFQQEYAIASQVLDSDIWYYITLTHSIESG